MEYFSIFLFQNVLLNNLLMTSKIRRLCMCRVCDHFCRLLTCGVYTNFKKKSILQNSVFKIMTFFAKSPYQLKSVWLNFCCKLNPKFINLYTVYQLVKEELFQQSD